MSRAKVKADCRADNRGGQWVGIPKCLVDSAAYRALSAEARAILLEIASRMNGYNNGKIGISQRELVSSLGCHNRKVIAGIAQLVEHGFLVVNVEGKWKERQAREYRLTFVSTKGAPATNDYLGWTPTKKKSGGAKVAPAAFRSDATAAPMRSFLGATAASGKSDMFEKTAVSSNEPDATLAPLITKPSLGSHFGISNHPRNTIAPSAAPACERCGIPFASNVKSKRFCSEACRKSAEGARRYTRSQETAV